MFTGVIENSGQFLKLQPKGKTFEFTISAPSIFKSVKLGDSVAVNGVCLSVVKKSKNQLLFNVLSETLKLTALGELQPKEKVNLELPLRYGQKINGHFVSGHVDGMATLTNIKSEKSGKLYHFKMQNRKLLKFVAQKGSIAIDGISLTVVKKSWNSFSVALIPLTLKWTNLGQKQPGERVNIEVDLMARYGVKGIARL
jgi:riboflavin synthase